MAGLTPGNDGSERAKAAEDAQGIWGPAFAVEVGHAEHITPAVPGFKLHVSRHVCQAAEVMTATRLAAPANEDSGPPKPFRTPPTDGSPRGQSGHS